MINCNKKKYHNEKKIIELIDLDLEQTQIHKI